MQKTLVILKPDAVSRALIGKITQRLEDKGLKLVACKMSSLSQEVLKQHYSHLADKPFFPEIIKYMTATPVILQVWEGEEAVTVVRKLIGATNPLNAEVGTIRGDLAISIASNLIHASESIEHAEVEIKRFFNQEEIYSYYRSDDSMLYFRG